MVEKDAWNAWPPDVGMLDDVETRSPQNKKKDSVSWNVIATSR
jgi:hypothetical protein